MLFQNEDYWEDYWADRLQAMDNLGKQAAILAASRLIRRLAAELSHPIRVLELGCGEGQVIGALLETHAKLCDTRVLAGIDYNARSLARCRKDYPTLRFAQGDFTDPVLLERLFKGQPSYDLILLVNALHEVFSAAYKPELGQVDAPAGKAHVEQALAEAVHLIRPGGWLLVFDGLEPPGDPNELLRIRFLDKQARANFETFASEYQPFKITFQQQSDPLTVTLSRRDFTRFIDKSIFLGKKLWETERLESYQYFTEAEFRDVFTRQGLNIVELSALTVNSEKWQRWVQIETPGVDFPTEHILILAQRISSPAA